MSMSTHVIGFKPPDEKWNKMKAIYDACEVAGVPIPSEVDDFFDGEGPDPAGVEVKLTPREWQDDMRQGYEIDIDSLPKGVKTIRFYNSW